MPSPETKPVIRAFFAAGVIMLAGSMAGAYVLHHRDNQPRVDPQLEQKHQTDNADATRKLGEMGVKNVLNVDFDSFGHQYVEVGESADTEGCSIHLDIVGQSSDAVELVWPHLDAHNHVIRKPLHDAAEVEKVVEAFCP